jgi:hypothetical protein
MGPSAPGLSNTADAPPVIADAAALYACRIADSVLRIEVTQSPPMSSATNGATCMSTSSLAPARSPAPVVTVRAALSHSVLNPRASTSTVVPTFASINCHSRFRNSPSARAALRRPSTVACAASAWRSR